MITITVDSKKLTLLTTSETATLMNVSVESIRRWVRLGYLTPFINAGQKGVFFRKDEIEAELARTD